MMKLTWWGWYFINYARHIHYKGTRSADGLQSARPSTNLSAWDFLILVKGVQWPQAVFLRLRLRSKQIYMKILVQSIFFLFFFFGLIWVIFHPLAFGQWVKVTFSDVRRSYRTHTQKFLFSKHISYSHSPSWLIL